MKNQELTQSQKVQAFRLATKIVLDIAEEIKSKSELEQKQVVNKTIGLLRELYPALTPNLGYARTYTGSKNQNDSHKLNEGEGKELHPFKY